MKRIAFPDPAPLCNILSLLVSVLLGFFLAISAGPLCAQEANLTKQKPASSAMKSPGPAYRFERNGWTYVHLEGSPSEIGYQHGYLLANEIFDTYQAVRLLYTHDSGRDWEFFREASRKMLWPRIDAEYREELSGIASGARARGFHLDVDDIVAINADMEIADYYLPWLKQKLRVEGPRRSKAPEACSAFIATGSYTKDHRIVMAHNNWASYIEGSRWTIVFDIVPQHGLRIVMDGMPGVITSQDDFGINSAGIMITETTIGNFLGWNPKGIPEFVRSRKALQYAASIDEYARIMRKGNNGGYANDWLIGDQKTGEIAYLELGLIHTPLWKTKDGYFVSSNFARDPKVIRDETAGYNPSDLSRSNNARHARWEQIMQKYKGSIDIAAAETFMGDHRDSYLNEDVADGRSLCGHIDNSRSGVDAGWGAYYPAGAVQGKVTDSELASRMSFAAHAGHPCGEDFLAAPFLARHPEYSWQAPVLKDMKSGPWTIFSSGEHAGAGGAVAGVGGQ